MWAALRPLLARDTAEGEALTPPLSRRNLRHDNNIRSNNNVVRTVFYHRIEILKIRRARKESLRIFERSGEGEGDFGAEEYRERERERATVVASCAAMQCETMQRRVEGNRRGLLRAVVGVARGGVEGAASSGRTGPAGPVAQGWGSVPLRSTRCLAFFPAVSTMGGGERREEGRGGDGEGYRGRGGAAYDPGQARAPSQLVYTLPRTIDNEPWRTAVVYCREFFGWPTESPTPNSFLHPRQNDLGRPRSLVKVKRGDAQLVK